MPLIFLSLMGAIMLIPWNIGPMPISTLVVIITIAWYSRLGSLASIVMSAQIFAALLISLGGTSLIGELNTAYVYAGIFVLAWIGQFVGHKFEGRSPSFFKDLQYLLIGPLWVWLGH